MQLSTSKTLFTYILLVIWVVSSSTCKWCCSFKLELRASNDFCFIAALGAGLFFNILMPELNNKCAWSLSFYCVQQSFTE